MITFYFDGFRGLEQTFLPLLDVNFFLGENSTGKTSVLSAMQVLSSDTFWYTGELRDEHIDFGSFEEIATKGRSNFQLGYFEESTEDDPELALLATFEPRNQKSVLTSIRILCNREEVHLTEHALMRVNHQGQTLDEVFREWLRKPFTLPYAESPRARRRGKQDVVAIHPLHAWSLFDPQQMWGLNESIWIAPIRGKPKRTYDAVGPEYSPEGDHTPYLLNQMLGSDGEPQKREILQNYGSDSGLFKDVLVHRFGNDDRSPLSVDIDLGPLRTSIFNVGYGVSQALPILVEVISRSERTLFTIQQPEVHLHPKAQAALGNFFFEMSREPHRKRFLLETHSDFIVDRFRTCMRKAADAGEQVPSAQVLFFQRKDDKNEITPIVMSSRGDYPEDQPAEFRAFFLQEELQNLGF